MNKLRFSLLMALFVLGGFHNVLQALPKCIFVGTFNGKMIMGVGDVHGAQNQNTLIHEPKYTPIIKEWCTIAAERSTKCHAWIEDACREQYEHLLARKPQIEDSMETLWRITHERDHQWGALQFSPLYILEKGTAVEAIMSAGHSYSTALKQIQDFRIDDQILFSWKQNMGELARFTFNDFLKQTTALIATYDATIKTSISSEVVKKDLLATLARAGSLLEATKKSLAVYASSVPGLLDKPVCEAFGALSQFLQPEPERLKVEIEKLCQDGGIRQCIGILGDIKLTMEITDIIVKDPAPKQIFYLGSDHVIALRKALLVDPRFKEIKADGNFEYEASTAKAVRPEVYRVLCQICAQVEASQLPSGNDAETKAAAATSSSGEPVRESSSSSTTSATSSTSPFTASSSTSTSTSSSTTSKVVKACNLCAKELAKPQRCSRCKSVVYCSPTCQRADWEKHKVRCAVVAQ